MSLYHRGLSLSQLEDAVAQVAAGATYLTVATRLGVTKNALLGKVHRHFPDTVGHRLVEKSIDPADLLPVDRLAALHERMDAVLLDCIPRPSHFIKERR